MSKIHSFQPITHLLSAYHVTDIVFDPVSTEMTQVDLHLGLSYGHGTIAIWRSKAKLQVRVVLSPLFSKQQDTSILSTTIDWNQRLFGIILFIW